MLWFGFENLRHKGGHSFIFSLKPLALSLRSLALSLFFIFCLVIANTAFAGNVTLAWNAPTERIDGTPVSSSEIKGYNLHYGTASGNYTQTQPITGNTTTYTITNLTDGANYYFAVSAIDTADKESGYSTEACKVIGSTTACATATNNGGGDTGTYSYSAGGDNSISGGGCGFAKDTNGKGQRANGEGLSLIIMLIITLTGISLARRTKSINATKEGVLVMNIRKISLIKIAAISFLLTIFWSASAHAQPNITSFSGSLTNKGALTITGSGFGTKAQAAPLKWDDFESGISGNILSGWDLYSSNGIDVKYSNSRLRTNSNISAISDFTTSDQYNSSFGLTQNPITRLYVSMWRFVETSGHASRNVKPVRLYGDYGSTNMPDTSNVVFPADNAAAMGGFGCTTNGYALWYGNDDDLPVGIWERTDYYWEMSEPGVANGNIFYWKNGALKKAATNAILREAGCNSNWNRLRIGNYFARDTYTPTPSGYIWWDDVYVDITQARVEIGNAPTWAASTHREIQIPSAWSDTGTSITITLNKGSFSNFNNIYLYVIDANGSVNPNGLPLCPTCLKPPTWQ